MTAPLTTLVTAAGASIDGRRKSTRERLIRTATGLFRRHGVTGTGVGEICTRAGVTKGVFTHHFPGGKDELVVAVVAANAQDVRRNLSSLDGGGQLSTPAAVEALFAAYCGVVRAKGVDFGCPVAAAVVDASSGSATVRAASAEAFASWRAALHTLAGGRPVLDEMESLIVAALEGAILMARAEQDPGALERVGRCLRQLLETYERPRPRSSQR